jgi:tRNA-intron endonuclease
MGIIAALSKGNIITENSHQAKDLHEKQRYGQQLKDGRIKLSFLEAVYLYDIGKLDVVDSKGKDIKREKLSIAAEKHDKEFWTRYAVYGDLRTRGYIVGTALKFGADFRVYERGVKPGEDHAKWIVYPIHESDSLTWRDFSAKNRVAHSTKKHVLLAIVDDEGDVSYWETRWVRP